MVILRRTFDFSLIIASWEYLLHVNAPSSWVNPVYQNLTALEFKSHFRQYDFQSVHNLGNVVFFDCA